MSDTQTVVVGTAGHIDHGKTSMVRTLTGVDLDTLPEERARGITIALGFEPLVLPDGQTVAFVDVPGHEGLVRTMVAGASGIDAVVLCVSAVDGVMPQTREHLDIVRLLDVQQGIVVMTMADLVDEDYLELALEDVGDLLEGTPFQDAPRVAFSAVTGQGRDELLAVLETLRPRERDTSGPFRLPVDRAFVRDGFGTVVTGTSLSGSLDDGAAVRLLPAGTSARVRGIQVHGVTASQARPGWRVALNLAAVDKEQVPRGTVVVGGDVPVTSMVDVEYHHLPDAPHLEDGVSVRFLVGTSEVVGHLHLAEPREELVPGMHTWAQLRLESPVACLPGDRFVVRRTSPVQTLGGGVVVDPWTPRMRRRHRVAWGEQIARLRAGEEVVWLERAGEAGLEPSAWRARAPTSAVAVRLGDREMAPSVAGRLEGLLVGALSTWHAEHPLALGAQPRELHPGRLGHLTRRVFEALVERLEASGVLRRDGPLVSMVGFVVELSDAQRALQGRILASVTAEGLSGLALRRIVERHPEPETPALVRLLEHGDQVAVIAGVGTVAREHFDRLPDALRGWFAEHTELTPGDFKTLTGQSRRTAIPWLEWLDGQRLTQRRGSARIPGPGLRG